MSLIVNFKKLMYRQRGEPIQYGKHKLRYIPGTRPVRLTYVDSNDVTVRNDALQIQFFLENVVEGGFVVDVGGHYGQYAVLLASLVSDAGRVVTFEPDPGAQSTLRKNLALNSLSDRVTVESAALFDQRGEHVLFSRGADSMSSLVKSGLGANAAKPGVNEYTVQTISLDDYLSEQAIPAPNFIKVDTEGAEICILRGARQLLRQAATTIVCELHPYAWEEFGVTFDDLLRVVSETKRSVEYLDRSVRICDGPVYGAVIIR